MTLQHITESLFTISQPYSRMPGICCLEFDKANCKNWEGQAVLQGPVAKKILGSQTSLSDLKIVKLRLAPLWYLSSLKV